MNLLQLLPRLKTAALRPEVVLQPHQQDVVEQHKKNRRLLLFHGLGTGKSLSSLALAEAAGGPYAAVAPASLRDNYRKELAKFTDGATPAEVLSYTQVGQGKQPGPIDTLILDEGQRLRSPVSAQYKGVKALSDRAKNLAILSATPVVNGPGDLAPLLHLLDSSNSPDPYDFEKRYTERKQVYPGFFASLMGAKPGVETVLKNKKDLLRRLQGKVNYKAPLQTDVQVQDKTVDVDMSPQQQSIHKAIWKQLPWLMRWKLQRDFPLSDAEAIKLRSFMTGPRQVGLSTLPFQRSPDAYKAFQQSGKLQAAMESLKKKLGDPNAKALVFANFIDAGLKPYGAALEREKIPYGIFHGGLSDQARKQLLADYNSNKLRVLMAGPSGTEGLSTKGTRLIQLLDPHFNETRQQQARGRGLRYDSHTDLPEDERNIDVERYVTRFPRVTGLARLWRKQGPPTADEILLAMAKRKQKLNDQFLDVLRQAGTR